MPDVDEATIESEVAYGYHYGTDDAGAVTQSFTMTGSGDLTVDPTQHHFQTFDMAGSGDMTVTPTVTFSQSFAMAGSGDLMLDTKFVAGVPSQGWHVVVIHPETGRRITASVLDRDPAILPSLGTLPEIRIPVRKNDAWLDEALEDDPPMLAWLDGQRLPIDELREVEDMPDHTLLVGVGATELEDRVSVEHRSEQRHEAARSLVTSETTYSEDVDNPVVQTLTDQGQFDDTLTGEFNTRTDFADTDPLTTSGDEITTTQTSFTVEAEDRDRGTDVAPISRSDFSGGNGMQLGTTTSQALEWDFTPQHTIPASDFEVGVRFDGGTGANDLTWYLDDGSGDEQISTYSPDTGGSVVWTEDIINLEGSAPSSDLEGGTQHTLRVEVNTDTGGLWEMDVVQPYDTGASRPYGPFNYTYDNDNGGSGGYLDGPELYPNFVNVESVDVESAFSIVGANATVTMSDGDTTGNQRVQVSNDRGQNWYPDDGTEDNTTSIDTDFGGNTGAAIRMRVTLDRYSPSGTRNETPREGYEGQAVTSWDLDADIDLELLLIDYKEDQSVLDHLNQFTTRDSLWSANLDANGDYQISWTQPGQRVGDDPDIGDFEVNKDLYTVDSITIFGSNKEIAGATFQASNTFEDTSPAYDDIVAGSETVYDDGGTNYDRNVDYQMDYTNGQITLEDGGDLTQGETYNIDFSVEVSGSYPENPGTVDREFTNEVAGVASDKAAEQIAFVLYEDFKNPRYAGTLSIPRADVSFDPLESLTLENLDLPANATPLEIRGDPQITPTGLSIRLGNRGRLEEALSDIASQVRAVSRRI